MAGTFPWLVDKESNNDADANGRLTPTEANDLRDYILTRQAKAGAVITGSGAPTDGTDGVGGATGVEGQLYIRSDDRTIYGPKTAGAWGSAFSLSALSPWLEWVSKGYTYGGLNTYDAFLASITGPGGLSQRNFYVLAFPDDADMVDFANYVLVAVIP